MFKKCKSIQILNRCYKHDWIQPEGYNTNIQVYNCVTKSKVPLIVRNRAKVSWYTCGPTVYDSSHIGHASCYVKLDIVQRILRQHFNLNLVTGMNITDIDDKIINKSLELGIPASEVALQYEKEFWCDLQDLNVIKPDIVVRVTNNIPLIIDFVEKLVEQSSAYVEAGSVYFDLKQKGINYGKLVPVEEDGKNFALWKCTKEGEPSWATKWGNGRPGWHTECSALASSVFGRYLDIHAGGVDLRFPHHENEEVISCAHHEHTQWVNYWLHAGHLSLPGGSIKMSKSLGNCVTIREMLDKHNPNTFRMACAMSHYRSGMEYSEELLKTADSQLNKFMHFLNECDIYISRVLPAADINPLELELKINESRSQIDEALKDDFNTARVIQILTDLVTITNKMFRTPNTTIQLNDCAAIALVSNFIREELKIFGFAEPQKTIEQSEIINILNILNEFRQNIRNLGLERKDKKILNYCDSLRDELKNNGVQIKDRGKISSWSK